MTSIGHISRVTEQVKDFKDKYGKVELANK